MTTLLITLVVLQVNAGKTTTTTWTHKSNGGPNGYYSVAEAHHMHTEGEDKFIYHGLSCNNPGSNICKFSSSRDYIQAIDLQVMENLDAGMFSGMVTGIDGNTYEWTGTDRYNFYLEIIEIVNE